MGSFGCDGVSTYSMGFDGVGMGGVGTDGVGAATSLEVIHFSFSYIERNLTLLEMFRHAVNPSLCCLEFCQDSLSQAGILVAPSLIPS
jgi:hypothetical protein